MNSEARVFGTTRVRLEISDITDWAVDAVVNAAQPYLTGGGGVDGAIHYGGGPAILKECQAIIAKIGSLETGKAVITTAGLLPAKAVIHTVGPIWYGGEHGEAELLAMAYRSCMALADQHGVHTLAFPSLSTGSYGYPVLQAAEIAMAEVKRYCEQEKTGLQELIFSLFSHADMEAYRGALIKV